MLAEARLTKSSRNKQSVDELAVNVGRISQAQDTEDSLKEFAGHLLQTREL